MLNGAIANPRGFQGAPMKTRVILKNKTKRPPRMLVLNLTTAVDSNRIKMETFDRSKDGEIRRRRFEKNVPGSLTIPSGQRVEVPSSYLSCPEVAAAISKGHVVVLEVEEPKVEVAPQPKVRRRK